MSGFRIWAFTPVLWDEESGINVGPQPTLGRYLSCAALLAVHCRLLVGEIGRFILECDNVLCLQQINSKLLWIMQIAECELPFQTFFCQSGC